jgi:hypothetical protein
MNRCHHCGGKFGLIRYRWWGPMFCRRACIRAHLDELARARERLAKWFDSLKPT